MRLPDIVAVVECDEVAASRSHASIASAIRALVGLVDVSNFAAGCHRKRWDQCLGIVGAAIVNDDDLAGDALSGDGVERRREKPTAIVGGQNDTDAPGRETTHDASLAMSDRPSTRS